MRNTPATKPEKKMAGAVHRLKRGHSTAGKGSVVSYCVHGAGGKVAAADFTAPKLIEVLQAGLPVRELNELQATLEVPMEKLGSLLGISKATLHRRKAQGRLLPNQTASSALPG
jgi:uncharacterized protein (DUF2384 family)